MASTEDGLHDLLVAKIQALALTYGGGALPVLKRKKVALLEGVDPPPATFVVPSEIPGSDVPFDTEGGRLRGHPFQVVIATAGNRDNLSGLPDHGDCRKAIWDALGKVDCFDAIDAPTGSHPVDVLTHELTPGPVIDREAVSKLYDYDSVCGVTIYVVEHP